MGKDSPSPPAAPDYAGAAQAQGAANVDTAIAQGFMNNPNVNSPYGNQTVTFGANNQPTVTQTLTPQSQQTLTAQQQTQTQLANLANQGAQMASGVLGTPFSFSGPTVQTSYQPPRLPRGYSPRGGENNLATSLNLSGVAPMPVNAGTTGQQAILNRLEPSLARQRTSTETQLINQGLRPGSEAYDNAIKLLGQQENDARQQAVLQGIALDLGANQQGYGQAVQSAQFGNTALGQQYAQGAQSVASENAALAQEYNQGLQSAQFGNTAQQQALAQALQQYNLPINVIAALTSGSQIQNPQFPSYQGTNIAPPQIAQAAAQQAQYGQNIYNQQMGQANANTTGLYSLGGAALGAAAM